MRRWTRADTRRSRNKKRAAPGRPFSSKKAEPSRGHAASALAFDGGVDRQQDDRADHRGDEMHDAGRTPPADLFADPRREYRTDDADEDGDDTACRCVIAIEKLGDDADDETDDD